jgi:hypothetical protein
MPDTRVEASFEKLTEDAARTAGVYLRRAIENIDSQFGKGYAKSNPLLVAAMIQASAADFQAAQTNVAGHAIADALQTGLERVGDALGDLARPIEAGNG